MKKEDTVLNKLWRLLYKPFGWIKRSFYGGSRTLSEDGGEIAVSPLGKAARNFFKRRIAVAALIILSFLFLFVFIAPLFFPIDLNYTNSLEANIAPTYSMMNVPSGLAGNVKTISGVSGFTVGVDNDGALYVWGNTALGLSGIDIGRLPDEIKGERIYTAAAGSDHIVAITKSGRIIAWGDKTRAQYGVGEDGGGLIYMPSELSSGIDPELVDQLVCGYQSTALIYDGRLYVWGNENALINLSAMRDEANRRRDEGVLVKKIALGNYYGMILYDDGSISSPKNLTAKSSITSERRGKIKLGDIDAVIVDIAATSNCFGLIDENGEIYVQGSGEWGETDIAKVPSGEKAVSITGGAMHFALITDKDRAYAWGHNDYGQANIEGKNALRAYTGAKQTYLIDENDALSAKYGNRGYIFGTDRLGRDVFRRIIHGGRMTMTVGAVAVIVSTIIAIIVGCTAGYFGGAVDLILMRITEIFSAIPFLPFAMLLSYVISKNPIGETLRIIIIMIILGLLSWPGLAKIVRAQVLSEREKEFVTAAKAIGVNEGRIAFRHILPNIVSVILVSITLDFAGCLLTESSLSYLGFGVQQPRPTWGNMLNGANSSIVIQNYWWQWVFPAIFLSVATVMINVIGDTLRDVLDPKSEGAKS